MLRVVVASVLALGASLCVGFNVPYSAGQNANRLKDVNGDLYAHYQHEALSPTDAKRAASHFLALSQKRRTLRFFDPERRPELDLITDCVLAAGTAPSGAHKQPWSYVIVRDAGAKRKIRDLVEQEEQTNYQTRMAQSWVSDLMPMMSNLHDSQAIAKPYLTEAPFLCCVFAQPYGVDADGRRSEDHYYVSESVGISLGIFLTALHSASLCSLVTTPMGAGKAIGALLGRPSHERLYALVPIGFPAPNATVPYRPQQRKSLDEILTVV